MTAIAPVQAQGHAHVHGVARLDIAVDAGSISFRLDSPLDNLLGFERAPRTAAEKRRADAAVARLRDGAALFRIDPAAQCVLSTMELESAALSLGTAAPAEASGHAEIEGSFVFSCKRAAEALYVDIGLFAFDALRRVDVQVATPTGQFKRDLSRPKARIELKR